MGNDPLEFIGKVIGLLGGLSGAAWGFAKFMRWMGTGKRDSAGYEIRAFQANIKALQDENVRCWADNARLREEHEVECEEWGEKEERLRGEIAKLREELALEVSRKELYRTEAHKLSNQIFEIAEQLHDCLGDLEGERRKPPNQSEPPKLEA